MRRRSWLAPVGTSISEFATQYFSRLLVAGGRYADERRRGVVRARGTGAWTGRLNEGNQKAIRASPRPPTSSNCEFHQNISQRRRKWRPLRAPPATHAPDRAVRLPQARVATALPRVHGPADGSALSNELLHGLSLPRLLRETPSEEISVWFSSGRGGGNESFKTSDAALAEACHRSGGSLYFRAPEKASELLVTALSQQVGLSFGALYPDGAPRSEVETFASKAGNVTHWHFDFMENFTLQLSGRKRWSLKRSSIDVPLRGCTPQWGTSGAAVASAAEQQAKLHAQHHNKAPLGGSSSSVDGGLSEVDDGCFEVILEPGSVLYVPAGYWHKVECLEEDSLSINVSLMGSTWADLIADSLRQRLLCHSEARSPICMKSIANGRAQLGNLLELAATELLQLSVFYCRRPCLPGCTLEVAAAKRVGAVVRR